MQYSDGTIVMGPVCGSATALTGTFACYSRRLLTSARQGKVADFR